MENPTERIPQMNTEILSIDSAHRRGSAVVSAVTHVEPVDGRRSEAHESNRKWEVLDPIGFSEAQYRQWRDFWTD